ncbi:MAG TPA: hypothetical protein VFC13_23900 [Actinomycetes bacterium]|nr:hypothetical protein [Actinomycetes bacterium]
MQLQPVHRDRLILRASGTPPPAPATVARRKHLPALSAVVGNVSGPEAWPPAGTGSSTSPLHPLASTRFDATLLPGGCA